MKAKHVAVLSAVSALSGLAVGAVALVAVKLFPHPTSMFFHPGVVDFRSCAGVDHTQHDPVRGGDGDSGAAVYLALISE